jgi:aryl-alcohol dehydrogenase-like predicted oxidoreductase
LLHETDILKTKYADFLIQKLIQLKDQNKIKKFGISIYEIDELESFYEIPFDVIQGPLNILDQRI